MMPMDGDSQHATGKNAFPDRPDHPDFWKLSEIVIGLDSQVDNGTPLPAIWNRLIDTQSLLYMARMRAARLAQVNGLDDETYQVLVAAFIDGFLAGGNFVKQ